MEEIEYLWLGLLDSTCRMTREAITDEAYGEVHSQGLIDATLSAICESEAIAIVRELYACGVEYGRYSPVDLRPVDLRGSAMRSTKR
jgi:hypothetical protein